MNDTVFIYSLADPFTYEIRYIGKTVHPKERLWSHLQDPSKTYRTNWIRQVVSRGGKPTMIILQVLPPGADWQEAEKKWILKAKDLGWPLTNCTEGGDGVPELPPEIKAKIASAWKGRKHRPESLEKIRLASTGRVHSEESKERMRRIMTGRQFTPEWKEKISDSVRKLTDCQVRVIRKMLARGLLLKEIARRFDVHWTTISNIKRGLFYTDVV